jgi:WD40 domain-containing protein
MNTMRKITLIIEAAGTHPQIRIEVEASTSVGTCVASLVDQLGYPRMDATGRPMMYRLRPIGSQRPLTNTTSFSECRIHPEMHVVLEAEGTSTATVPLGVSDISLTLPLPRERRWNRRSFITLTLVGCSVVGLGMGAVAAFAQRSFLGREGDTSVLPEPQHSPTAIPRGVALQYIFSGHSHTVRVVGWSPDGTMLASGGDDSQTLIGPLGTAYNNIWLIQSRCKHSLGLPKVSAL